MTFIVIFISYFLGVGGGIKINDYMQGVGSNENEKKTITDKKKNEKLEEDIKLLQIKIKSYEENNNKLQQKQSQLLIIRKQLKIKDDELISIKDGIDTLVNEKEILR